MIHIPSSSTQNNVKTELSVQSYFEVRAVDLKPYKNMSYTISLRAANKQPQPYASLPKHKVNDDIKAAIVKIFRTSKCQLNRTFFPGTCNSASEAFITGFTADFLVSGRDFDDLLPVKENVGLLSSIAS